MAAGIANYRFYLRQRPVMLALLSALAVVFFLAVTGLSRSHYAQREALGDRWFSRGVADLHGERYGAAVTEFRSALLYSPDNYAYQLNLAEALIGLKRTGEASSYLLNLWDRQPEDGLVNLELARIAAAQGQIDQAVRYYHDAIYATWSAGENGQRRQARLELIELWLRNRSPANAQAELLAFAENAGDDAPEQNRIGQLFLRAQDAQHALNAFRTALRLDQHNPVALAGAGQAAFALGEYSVAQPYLQAAVTADPNDSQSADRLKTTELVLSMDPFRRDLSVQQRNRAVVQAFAIAGRRLKTCAVPSAPGSGPSMIDNWMSLNSEITEVGLRRNPDLAETAMELVFRIERETNDVCGPPTGPDLALLLMSKLPEGN